MRLWNSRIPEEHLVCYQTSQRNWVIIKMLYRCLRWCLLSWHRSRLGFFTPIVGEVSQGPLVWHPKFYLDFSKDFIWLEGGDLNFSSNIFYGKGFIWIHPRSVFGLGGSCFSFGLKTKCLSFGENNFWKSFWKCTMAFGITLCHFQQFLLAMVLVQILSPNPSLTFGSWFASNPASWTSSYDLFHSNSIQINFCLLL